MSALASSRQRGDDNWHMLRERIGDAERPLDAAAGAQVAHGPHVQRGVPTVYARQDSCKPPRVKASCRNSLRELPNSCSKQRSKESAA